MDVAERYLAALYQHLPNGVLDKMRTHAIIALLKDIGLELASIGICNDDLITRIRQIKVYRKQLHKLRAIPHIEQRSPEWYELRKQRLTASSAAEAMGCGKFRTRAELLQSKVDDILGRPSTFNSNSPPLKWGVMLEPMAARTYAQHKKTRLYEFGMLPHPVIDCFGASPDNITDLGIMVEYKCPWRRRMDNTIPQQYEIQMQGQMAVCGLHECDYVECDIQEFANEEDYKAQVDANATVDHGVILEYIVYSNGDRATQYEYSPENLTPEEAYSWANTFTHPNRNVYLARIHPWKLRRVWIHRVFFDNERWLSYIPQIEQFWGDVMDAVEREKKNPRMEDSESGSSASSTTSARGKRKTKKEIALVVDFITDSDEER